jgi:hypothetical protein
MLSRLPRLATAYHAKFAYMDDEEPGPYIVFGSVLVPALAEALEEGDLGTILPICAFLEDASIDARKDNGLAALLKAEVSEWLGWAANEDRLAPWLGSETKLICNYAPGLATQRRQLRDEKKKRGLFSRFVATFKRSSPEG